MGWVRPLIVVPASTLAGLSPKQLEAILVHELAHVRRHDYAVNVLQTVIETAVLLPPGGLVDVSTDPRRTRALLRRSRRRLLRRSADLRSCVSLNSRRTGCGRRRLPLPPMEGTS